MLTKSTLEVLKKHIQNRKRDNKNTKDVYSFIEYQLHNITS